MKKEKDGQNVRWEKGRIAMDEFVEEERESDGWVHGEAGGKGLILYALCGGIQFTRRGEKEEREKRKKKGETWTEEVGSVKSKREEQKRRCRQKHR
mmetsp:Transcript_26670/g.52363  ORF Transcript_26670/g.52363 Transcript_26670/m.52363 type:complete len:96 (+) Transcript_26670:637-924(+)